MFTAGMEAVAQLPAVQSRWFSLQTDSLRVEYAHPPGKALRPAVVVLSDRFGAQDNVRSMLQVLARMGYRAYAPPLRSAPLHAVAGAPEISLDTMDTEIVTQIAVDIMSESGCNGRIAFLAFDVGSLVAIDVLSRFPFYKSAALFYPPKAVPILQKLLHSTATLQLHVAQFDTECTLKDVNTVREQFMDAGKRLNVLYYKDAYRFFFNPEHENWHKPNTQHAWNQVLKLFRSTL